MSEAQYRGGPIYEVTVKKIVDSPYSITIDELADGSGDGLVFFHWKWMNYDYPIIGGYKVVDAGRPIRGAIGFGELAHTDKSFTFYFATEKSMQYAYVDVRFTIQDEHHRRKRILIRVPINGVRAVAR